MQLVVVSAVRNAVSAATITFTASSIIRFFVIFLRIFNSKESRNFGIYSLVVLASAVVTTVVITTSGVIAAATAVVTASGVSTSVSASVASSVLY